MPMVTDSRPWERHAEGMLVARDLCQIMGSRSSGSKVHGVQQENPDKHGECQGATSLRLVALCTMPLASRSTISTRISTAA